MYKEYQRYMGISEPMPDFQIKHRKATRDRFAYVQYVNGKYILTIDPIMSLTDFMKSTLYHEFTHIYDDMIMKHFGFNKEESYIYHAYTEYHASQIGMMTKLNIQTAYDSIRCSIDDDVLCNELLKGKQDFTDRVSEIDLSKMEGFSKAIDWFCYYIGKASTLIQYFNIHTAAPECGSDLLPIRKQQSSTVSDLRKFRRMQR